MTTHSFARAAGTVLVVLTFLGGCSSHPATGGQTTARAVRDRTPSWMKYQVTGSRIARPVDGHGKPITADMVRSTSREDLSLLPSVTFSGGGR